MPDHRDLLTWFMEARKEEVFSIFENLQNAERQDGFVFLPGSLEPERRVLLVAHADTVWDGKLGKKGIEVRWDGFRAVGSGSLGLGADDRAGCAMLWLMQSSGHSLLLTDEEETGCIGAGKAVAAKKDELAEHAFAVQMDRRGDCQAVFYSAATKEFQDWLLRALGEPWRKEWGSFSDVAEICPRIGINGVNLSAGFLDEHTSSETLLHDAWWRSVKAAERLSKLAEGGRLPEFGSPPHRRRAKSYWNSGESAFQGSRSTASSFYQKRWDKRKQVTEDFNNHSSYCQCMACMREVDRVLDERTGGLSGGSDSAGDPKWKPSSERGWKEKELSHGCKIFALWDGDEATLQDSPKKATGLHPEDADEDEEAEEEQRGGDSSLSLLLSSNWDGLDERQQGRAKAASVSCGVRLAQSGKATGAAEEDYAQMFFDELIMPAFNAGLIDSYEVAVWEWNLIHCHDESDPRVEALMDGIIWGFRQSADAI